MPIDSLEKNGVHNFLGKVREFFSALYSCGAKCNEYLFIYLFLIILFLTDQHSYFSLGQKYEERWNGI